MRHILILVGMLLFVTVSLVPTSAQNQTTPSGTIAPAQVHANPDKPRVFITDSQSWETRGSAGGSNGNWGAETHGGARPQTAEVIKTFGDRCPEVMVNNRIAIADYIVVLEHEGGKGYLQHRNKVAVFENLSGDAIMSHSTLSLGNSVKDACAEITKHWAQHATEIRAGEAKQAEAAAKANAPAAPVVVAAAAPPPAAPKISVSSTPDGADIEVDGSFVGNTPSTVELTSGEHQVVVKRSGYKDWSRKLKVSGGDVKLNAELEK